MELGGTEYTAASTLQRTGQRKHTLMNIQLRHNPHPDEARVVGSSVVGSPTAHPEAAYLDGSTEVLSTPSPLVVADTSDVSSVASTSGVSIVASTSSVASIRSG